MKRTLPFFLFLFLFQICAKAQIPDYFANNPVWKETDLFLYSCCGHSQNLVYYVNGDTLINTFTYKKVFQKNYFSHGWLNPAYGCNNPPPPFPYPCGMPTYSESMYCFLRQDSLKIWMYDEATSQDSMIYDFNLFIGDTINKGIIYDPNAWSPLMVVDNIDSVLVGSGYRKRFVLNDWVNGILVNLIEGVGHDGGFLFPYVGGNVSGAYHWLDCYSQNDTTWYTTPNGNCILTLDIQNGTRSQYTKLLPNPANEYTTLIFSDNEEVIKIEAIDILGKTSLVAFEKADSEKIILNVLHLQSGVYTLRIQSQNNLFAVKFIKE